MKDVSLAVFVVAMVVNILGLLVDYALERYWYMTVTNLVDVYPLVGVPIVLFQFALPMSLGIHFWSKT